MAHPSRTFCILTLLVVTTTGLHAQRYQMKKQVTDKNSAPLLKMADDLFTREGNLSLNVSTHDTRATFDEIPDAIIYDDAYLHLQQEALKKDSIDPMALYNLGQYYLNNNRNNQATWYLNRALNNLQLKYVNNDSSQYYQMRGFIKTALGEPSSANDFERAVTINPKDSVSNMFYIISLFQQGKYDEMKTHCVGTLEQKWSGIEVSYIMLICAEILGTAAKKIPEINDDTKPGFRKLDYNQFFNLTTIDQYAKKYAAEKYIQIARNYADVLALLFKLTTFDQPADKMSFKLQYTKNDIKRLKELQVWLEKARAEKTINPYSVNKVLGFVYYMVGDNKKSYASFQEATRVFPSRKKTGFFQPTECYEGLIFTSKLVKVDDKVFIDILETKISTGDSIARSNDCMTLALYFFEKKDLDNAWKWCTQAGMYNSLNPNALMLYAHLCYKKKDIANAEHHISVAMNNLSSYDQQKKVCLQTAIYFLVNNDATNAYTYIRHAEKSMEGAVCDECVKLIDQYITIIPE